MVLKLEIVRSCFKCKKLFRISKLRSIKDKLYCSICYQVEIVKKFKKTQT
jgi:hypothetical protein